MSLRGIFFLHFAPGPRRILAGSIINAERKAKIPFMVKPIMRNGSVRSQTIGYNTRARNANGQHKKRRMIQRINVNMMQPPYGILIFSTGNMRTLLQEMER
jgi:hypothetical protein